MAKPIPLELPLRDPRETLRRRLENAPAEHAEALLSAYEVLQGLHDRGVLELLRGVLGSSDHVLQILVDAAKTPEAIRAIRNLVIVVRIAGSLDPKLLEGMAQALSANLGGSAAAEPPGLWQISKKLRSKDTRRALAALTGVLESVGRTLGPGGEG